MAVTTFFLTKKKKSTTRDLRKCKVRIVCTNNSNKYNEKRMPS